ncbi:MAG: hypothetical protein WC349_02835 [Patescibacteria group bacterium]|jgi:hypothetical protein
MENSESSKSGNGNGKIEGTFKLGQEVMQSIYNKPLYKFAGQVVKPEAVQIKGGDKDAKLIIVVRGTDNRPHSVSLPLFTEHPPEEELRKIAQVI